MIVTSGMPVEDLKETTPSREFRVQPPTNNPLVAASGLSLLKKENDSVFIEWAEEKPVPVDDLLAKVRTEFVSRSKKDVAKYPSSARAHTNLGIALMNQGQLLEAVREFETALSIDPHHYVAGTTLAKIRVEQNRLDEAEKIYSELQNAFPGEFAPSLSLAFIAMKRFDFENAERLFRRTIALGDNAVLTKYMLAMVLLRLRKNREAISLLKTSVHAEVRSPALYQALGVAYAMAGDHLRAELNFKTALTLAPNMTEAVHGLSRVLIDHGKASSAQQLLARHLEKMPNDEQARELLAQAYNGIGQYRSAAQQLIQVFNRLPDGPEDVSNSNRKAFLATAIGTYFGFDRREKESETWLLRAIKFAPQRDALPYQNLGRLYLRTDQELKAYRILMECKALFPEAQDTYVLLGSVYERQGLYDEGIRELEPLLKTGRAEPSDYSALGCLLDYKGDLSSAVTILREGHNKHPEDRSIIHNLAYVLLMNHELAEGRQILETYRDDLEDYASKDLDYESVLTATRGLLYLLEGRVDVGVQLYKQAARSASRVGSRQLAGAVLQKMHIEMTKLFLSRSDYASAKREIAAGLAIKRGREPFRRELKLLEVATNNVQ